MKMKHKLVALLGAAALLPAFAQAQNLVVDGSFDLGPSDQQFQGWTVTPASSSSLLTTGQPSEAGAPATNAAFFGAFGGVDDTISQTLATTAGTTYDVSFSVLMSSVPANADSTSNPLGDFSASFGGKTLLSLTDPGSGTWINYNYTVTATGASTLLSFSGRDDPSFNDLTLVSVTPVVAAVPEPQEVVLLLAGLGVLGFAMRGRMTLPRVRAVA